MTSDPHDRPTDPFYDGRPAWEARGDIAPTDHTDWETVETFQPKHRATRSQRAQPSVVRGDLGYVPGWRDPDGDRWEEATWTHLDGYTPRHRAAS